MVAAVANNLRPDLLRDQPAAYYAYSVLQETRLSGVAWGHLGVGSSYNFVESATRTVSSSLFHFYFSTLWRYAKWQKCMPQHCRRHIEAGGRDIFAEKKKKWTPKMNHLYIFILEGVSHPAMRMQPPPPFHILCIPPKQYHHRRICAGAGRPGPLPALAVAFALSCAISMSALRILSLVSVTAAELKCLGVSKKVMGRGGGETFVRGSLMKLPCKGIGSNDEQGQHSRLYKNVRGQGVFVKSLFSLPVRRYVGHACKSDGLRVMSTETCV